MASQQKAYLKPWATDAALQPSVELFLDESRQRGDSAGLGVGDEASACCCILGVASNEVEKCARATTSYQIKVRMNDGSLLTLTQPTAPAVGRKVTVEGSTLRVRGQALSATAPRTTPAPPRSRARELRPQFTLRDTRLLKRRVGAPTTK